MAEVRGQFAGRDGDAGGGCAFWLPPRRSSFVGRTADLAEVAARLAEYPVVTLTGVGGVGKTALAIEAAWTEASAGRADLACYVDLVPCRTEEQVVAALVEGSGSAGRGRRLALMLSARRCRVAGHCSFSTTVSTFWSRPAMLAINWPGGPRTCGFW